METYIFIMENINIDKKKEIQPENLHRIIERNSRIFIGSGCSEPIILTEQLVKKKWEYTDCEIIHFLTISDNKFFDDRDPNQNEQKHWDATAQ